MKPYSTDLRERIVAAVGAGEPVSAAARRFQVADSTARRYLAQYRALGHVRPKPYPGSRPLLRPEQEAALHAQVQRYPDATVTEHCTRWATEQGQQLSRATMQRAIVRLGWTRKKSGSQRWSRTQ